MAISATKLHQEFRRRVNRINSDKNSLFDVPTIDSYLNEAQDIFYTNRLALLETNPQVREDLRKAEVKNYCAKCTLYKNDNRICIVKLPDNCYRRISQTANVSCSDFRDCDDKDIILRAIQSDDLSEALKDPFRKPSFEFEEGFIDEGEEGLYVYHNNAYKVNKVCINYYKTLPRIAAPSLISPDGYYIDSDGVKIDVNQGFILDSTDCWIKVVDIATLIALRDSSDYNNYQSELNKILQLNQLHIN